MAVAEQKFQFEHRDLHWGNILLSLTEEKFMEYEFNKKIVKIPTHGVKAVIIDYTLSRLVLQGQTLFNDLSKDFDLFSASGDYQFEIYRLMKKELNNKWNQFSAKTNVLWLDYILDKLITGVHYKASKTVEHIEAFQTLKNIRMNVLNCINSSAVFELC